MTVTVYGGNFLLLGVANVWDRRKGLDDFIRLRASLPEDVSVLLVGLTAKQIRLLPKGIIGIGRTESIEELAWIYAAADLFVNASVEETFGLTTVESLACGTPAVVYRSTACPELITPNVGFVVEPGNIEDIVQKTLVVREQGKSFYTGFCRQHAVEHFRKEDCYAEYIRLYEELLYQSK